MAWLLRSFLSGLLLLCPVGLLSAQVADIDGNSQPDAHTDGLLVLRYLFGFTGEALVAGALGPGATRTDPGDIAAYLQLNAPHLDIDADHATSALTDGLLLLRYLSGFTDGPLVTGAVGPEAYRNTPELAAPFLASLLTASSDVAALTVDTGPFGALLAGRDGSLFLPLVERDDADHPTRIAGALWMDTASGSTIVVHFGADGLPDRAVMGDSILLFSNWNADGSAADIARIYTPTGYIEIFRRESEALLLASRSTHTSTFVPGTCFPACDTDTRNLAELLKFAGLGISVGACGVATAVSLGAMALPCASVIVTTAAVVWGNETWLEDALNAADILQCGLLNVESCISATLDMSGRALKLLDLTVENNSGLVTTANLFLADPEQPSGVAQPGGGLPDCPGDYECTPGGAMSFLPCYPDGVRECAASCTWGACASACGDGTCDAAVAGENLLNCPDDCLDVCGDGICSAGEDSASCSADCGPPPCSYTYSEWSACQANDTQTRTVLASEPAQCTGAPQLEQACSYQASTCCACTFDVFCEVFGFGGCWICSNSSYVNDVCQAPGGFLTSPGPCACDALLYQYCP